VRRPLAPTAAAGALTLFLGGCAGTLFGDGDPGLYAALDDTDLALATSALQESLETAPNAATTDWFNPASGHQGSITPRATVVTDTGSFCRRYDEALTLADGQRTTLRNTACRDAEGRWVWIAD
jgi:surface antigen